MQLALDPIRLGRAGWTENETRRAFERAGVEIVSGMMAPAREDYASLESIRATGGLRPDETWEENRAAAMANAALAHRLGIRLVTLHAGCVPENPADPRRATLLARLSEVCEAFARQGVRVAFETGQDPPRIMLETLDALSGLNVGVNFDPANMILYGGADPIEALRILAPRVLQLHLKDALPAKSPGEWGTEVPAGRGSVDWTAFFAIVRDRLRGAAIVVEREAGDQRVEDVRAAIALARRMVETPP